MPQPLRTRSTATPDSAAARVIDSLERASQALHDAQKALYFAQMDDYDVLKGMADQVFRLTLSLACNEMGLATRHCLARSLATKIADARARYESQGEIDLPYAQEWLIAMEDFRQRLTAEEGALSLPLDLAWPLARDGAYTSA